MVRPSALRLVRECEESKRTRMNEREYVNE